MAQWLSSDRTRVPACLSVATLVAVLLMPRPSLAWGNTGHREVSGLGMEALPDEIPAFLRGADAIRTVMDLGPEPDRSKTAGTEHDAELDPGHFVDLDDEGKVLGIVPISELPPTRLAFDTALRAGGATQYGAGYLPYNLVAGWQQVRKDFAYIRADLVGLRTAPTPEDRAYFRRDLEERRRLTIRDIGVWSHYVADSSQPLHVSVHFNGWGNFPNPDNFTNAGNTHSQFEGAFVRDFVTREAIAAAIPPYRDCACTIEQRTEQYLTASLAEVIPFYWLATRGAFLAADAEGAAFAAARLGAGAAELRDMIIDAWRASATWVVGFPLIKVEDIESGAVQLTRTSYASD